MYRDGVYYYVRRIPCDLTSFYSVKRLCFSLKTKSLKAANRSAASISQRLDDYWLGLRLQKTDIPAIHLTERNESNASAAPALSDACDLYLRLKGIGRDKVFKRTAKRNTAYVIKVLGDRPLDNYSSSDAATFRDWLLGKGMSVKTVKRVFASVRSIVNLTISEEGLGCSNAFARTYFPEESKLQTRKPIPKENMLRKHVPSGCVVHSFRHSMRDRLGAVECPAEIIDQIGGWKAAGVGEGYGVGFEPKALLAWLRQI